MTRGSWILMTLRRISNGICIGVTPINRGKGGFLAFLFFKAEDGIRGGTVTGVQTCALPISELRQVVDEDEAHLALLLEPLDVDVLERSEERRVGKEGRSRWSPYH